MRNAWDTKHRSLYALLGRRNRWSKVAVVSMQTVQVLFFVQCLLIPVVSSRLTWDASVLQRPQFPTASCFLWKVCLHEYFGVRLFKTCWWNEYICFVFNGKLWIRTKPFNLPWQRATSSTTPQSWWSCTCCLGNLEGGKWRLLTDSQKWNGHSIVHMNWGQSMVKQGRGNAKGSNTLLEDSNSTDDEAIDRFWICLLIVILALLRYQRGNRHGIGRSHPGSLLHLLKQTLVWQEKDIFVWTVWDQTCSFKR